MLKMNNVSGKPSTSKTCENVERVKTLVRSDLRLTLRMSSEPLNLNRFIIHQILSEHLHMRKICAKVMPKNLSIKQKDMRQQVSSSSGQNI